MYMYIYTYDTQIKSWSYFCKIAYYMYAVRNNLLMHRLNFKLAHSRSRAVTQCTMIL